MCIRDSNHPVPPDALTAWLKNLKNAGIRVCIISNNRRRRVEPFARQLGVGFFCNAFKPRPYFYLKGLEVLNVPKEECVVIGDQLFTDVKGAKRCGIRAFLVDPVGEETTLFIKIKRYFEKREK